MSAYVVQDATINGVVTYIARSRDFGWLRTQIERQTGCDLNTPDGCKQLADAMFKLNCNAVDQRYGEGESASFRPLDFQYRLEPNIGIIRAYKRLGCWLYQCSEGDVPDTSLLFSAMKEVYADLAHHIVTRSKEYESCTE